MTITPYVTAVYNALVPVLPSTAAFSRSKLLPSAGRDGVMEVGVSPDSWNESPRNINTAQYRLLIQVYDAWDPAQVDPQDTDTVAIEAYADTVITTLKTIRNPSVGGPGYALRATGVQFMADPAGEITRCEVSVLADGDNPMWL